MIRILTLALAVAVQATPLPHLPLNQALDHLRSGVVDFDMVAARDDYSAAANYKAYGWEDRDTAYAALNKHKPAEALKLAEKGIAEHPLDSDAWAMKAEAEKVQGNAAAFDHDIHIAVEILRAIERTGDGMSAASAWHVITVSEEYALLSVKGFKVGNQALIHQDGHSFDRLDVTDTTTRAKSSRWFNIDRVYGHEL